LTDKDVFCTNCGTKVAKITSEEFTVSADNLVDRVRELLHEGNVTRIIIKDAKGKVLLEIPATVGVVGVVLAPWLAALGVIAALATNCRIVVERREE
jgi:CBS domain-containing protein